MSPRPVHAAIGAIVTAAQVAACGGGSATLNAATLSLPTTGSPSPIATTEVATSPDGGIYRNPVALGVELVSTVDPASIERRLGDAASGWADLHRLGRFTVVAFTLTNHGKAGSEPGLNDLQVATGSTIDPAGTNSGSLRRFYHPTFPLAALSTEPVNGDCTVHLDPGQSTTVLLLYPPLLSASTLDWGRYQDFTLHLHPGGVATGLSGDLSVRLCTPPQPPGG